MSGKIMIVDDQPGIRLLLGEVLKNEGYTTLAAGNGTQALQMIAGQDVALVLLDLRLPGMSGTEVLKQIREHSPETRIIIMTAYTNSEIAREAMESGAIACFSKPFDLAALVAAVKKEMHQLQA
ncbi:response regulator [Sporolactobacillus vineae]|uniref:response regulator n=1 Tax=Sporolactobacillus vineae TaxID=444463 RepID=UPI000288B677|nr:response regulator [Sporolactobacillus vineae]